MNLIYYKNELLYDLLSLLGSFVRQMRANIVVSFFITARFVLLAFCCNRLNSAYSLCVQ